MNGDYENRLNDVLYELLQIKKWINKNQKEVFTKYLISYAVMKSCARIEVIIKEIIYNFLTENGNSYAQNFISHYIIDKSTNPSVYKICKLVRTFSKEIYINFKEKIKKSSYIESDINSLVNLRNDFAHGRDITVSIDTVITYYKSAIEVIILLQEALELEDVIDKNNINASNEFAKDEEIKDCIDESV